MPKVICDVCGAQPPITTDKTKRPKVSGWLISEHHTERAFCPKHALISPEQRLVEKKMYGR